jgi:uncharacterized membrane protein
MNGETDLARVSRIGDSVFAVTITLLAYRIRIPSHEALASGELVPLIPFLSDLGAVMMSFFVASMFWISHWRVMRRMQRSDIKFAALNLAFLGALILLPISTSLLSGAPTRLGSFVYSCNLFLAATAGMFLRMHARRIEPEAFNASGLLLSPALSMLLFGGAAIVSLQWPTAAMALWWCAVTMPWIDRRWGLGPST